MTYCTYVHRLFIVCSKHVVFCELKNNIHISVKTLFLSETDFPKAGWRTGQPGVKCQSAFGSNGFQTWCHSAVSFSSRNTQTQPEESRAGPWEENNLVFVCGQSIRPSDSPFPSSSNEHRSHFSTHWENKNLRHFILRGFNDEYNVNSLVNNETITEASGTSALIILKTATAFNHNHLICQTKTKVCVLLLSGLS